MWSIRKNMEDIGRRKGKVNWEKSGLGEMNHERLWTLSDKLEVLEGSRWGVGRAWWWVLRRARIAWSTGCGA